MAHQAPVITTSVGIKDAAFRHGVSQKTIRRWIAQGLLPAERVGPRLIRIKIEDLDNLGHKIGGAA